MSPGTTRYYYQDRLKQELARRMEGNPRYSLRSFAQTLGIDSSALSQIIAGKRAVSSRVVNRILGTLELSPVEQKEFLESVMIQKKDKGIKRISRQLTQQLGLAKQSARQSGKVNREVGLDEFRVIADWYHYAILEMTFAENFQSDMKWIAKTLNLGVMEAKLAVDRLLQLDLLEWSNGHLRKTNFNLDTRDKTKTSAFLRRRQRQILEKSIHSLENDPIEDRNHSGLTVCIDPRQIPEAKQHIQTFLWELGKTLVKGSPSRVYELNVNLIPLQKKEK